MPEQGTLVLRIGMQAVFSKVISNSLSDSSSSCTHKYPIKEKGQCLYQVKESDFQYNKSYLKGDCIQSSLDNSSWNENNLDILVDGLTNNKSKLSRIKTMLPNENRLQKNCNIKLLSSQIDTKENVTISFHNQVHQNNFCKQIPLTNQDLKCANCDHFPPKRRWPYKTKEELERLHRDELQIMIEELSCTVKEVSEELVPLLQEKDSLQDEIDARNIVIEQLLKLTWRHTQMEPRPIQMSVILPNEKENEKDNL